MGQHSVFISGVTSATNGEDGIKLDVGGGPITVLDSVVDGNAGSDLRCIRWRRCREHLHLEELLHRKRRGCELLRYRWPRPVQGQVQRCGRKHTGMYLSDERDGGRPPHLVGRSDRSFGRGDRSRRCCHCRGRRHNLFTVVGRDLHRTDLRVPTLRVRFRVRSSGSGMSLWSRRFPVVILITRDG